MEVKDLYTENYNALLKYNKESSGKCPSSWIGTLYIFNTTLKNYRFNTIPLKIHYIFGEMENLNLNFTYNNKNHEYPKTFEKEEQFEGFIVFNLRT